jgi:hypothetical protein
MSDSPKRAAFLAAFAECGNIKLAAKLAECDRSMHYHWLEDPDYERAFAAAKAEACDSLEAEARRRAMDGTERRIYHRGVQLDTIREYSDTLLIFLMKGAMPDKYRDNWKGEITGLTPASRIDLSTATDAELEQLEALTRALSERRTKSE